MISRQVVQGDNTGLSSKHARVIYSFKLGIPDWLFSFAACIANSDFSLLLPAGLFELTVMGKNGVSLDGVLLTPNSAPAPLASKVQDV